MTGVGTLKRKRGFTLIELLVVVAIMGVVSVGVANLFVQVSRGILRDVAVRRLHEELSRDTAFMAEYIQFMRSSGFAGTLTSLGFDTGKYPNRATFTFSTVGTKRLLTRTMTSSVNVGATPYLGGCPWAGTVGETKTVPPCDKVSPGAYCPLQLLAAGSSFGYYGQANDGVSSLSASTPVIEISLRGAVPRWDCSIDCATSDPATSNPACTYRTVRTRVYAAGLGYAGGMQRLF